MLNDWEDEEEAMKRPSGYRCYRCKNVFGDGQVRMIIIEYEGKKEGYFLCFDCLEALKPNECPFKAYKDVNRHNFICDNCPIPFIVCDLRDRKFFKP